MPILPSAISTGWLAAARALCGNHADADDLVQEVYLTLLRRPRRLKRGSEMAYLMTMLRNAQIDRYRAAARRQTSALDEAEEPEDPRSGLRPDRAPSTARCSTPCTRSTRRSARPSSPSTCSGCPTRRPAHALDVPVGTVMSRLARGRERVIARARADAGGVRADRVRPRWRS